MPTVVSEPKEEETTLRRQVYEAIVALSDPVSSDVLLSQVGSIFSWIMIEVNRGLSLWTKRNPFCFEQDPVA